MKRRIVQVAVAPPMVGDSGRLLAVLAVADDGTLWQIAANDEGDGWEQVRELPDASDDDLVGADYEIVDERTQRIEAAIATINRLHSLGDSIYHVRERYGGDAVEGVPYTGDSWFHPKVSEYSNAVEALRLEGLFK